MGLMDTGEQTLTTEEALMHYFQRIDLSTDDINPLTLAVHFPNGLTGSLHQDVDEVLGYDLIRVAGDSYEDAMRNRLSRDFIFMLGIAVGAAMQRDGVIPGDLAEAVAAIGTTQNQGEGISG